MTQNVALLHGHDFTMIQMKVRAAYGGSSDLKDNIIVLGDFWNRGIDNTNILISEPLVIKEK